MKIKMLFAEICVNNGDNSDDRNNGNIGENGDDISNRIVFFSFVNLMVFQLCELDGVHVSQTNRLRLRCLRSCHCKSTIAIVFLDAIASPNSYPYQ